MLSLVHNRSSWIPALSVSVTVLLALAGDRAFLRTSPAAGERYHAAVRAAVAALPVVNRQFVGVDIPVPAAAVKMLHPNIILSRRFTNIATDESVSFLLVHVRDARDTLGHYPPICYPGQGWKMQSMTAVDFNGDHRLVHGTEYIFERGDDSAGATAGGRLVVDNFLMLPDGRTCRDMDAVEQAAQDRKRKFFGAAQIQVVFGPDVSPDRRHQIVESFIRYAEPAFAAISSGGKYEQQ
jgi:hypothetical protein